VREKCLNTGSLYLEQLQPHSRSAQTQRHVSGGFKEYCMLPVSKPLLSAGVFTRAAAVSNIQASGVSFSGARAIEGAEQKAAGFLEN